MALYGSFNTVRTQAPQTPGFSRAFAYVANLLQPTSVAAQRLGALAAGESHKTDLGGGVFAIEQVYETKLRAAGFFESHQKYIDVQVVVEGEEAMELADVARMTVLEPYLPERDLIVYSDEPQASILRVLAGEVAVFHPADVHMPSLQVASTPMLVRKAVVKIPVH